MARHPHAVRGRTCTPALRFGHEETPRQGRSTAGPSTSLRTLPEARPQSSTGATACAPQRFERDLSLRPLAGTGELEKPARLDRANG